MKLSNQLRFLLSLGVCAGLAGCRGVNPTAEQLVVRELREQEDYIYELEDQLDEYETTLKAVRQQNESLKRELGRDAASNNGESNRGARTKRSRDGGLFPNLRRRDSKSSPPVTEPEINLGDESSPEPNGPSLGPSSNSDAAGATVDEASNRSQSLDRRAVKLVINRQLSGGASHDPRSNASQGLMIVFEPRNAQNQLVPPQGDVAIVAVDPSIPGAAGRVGRWDFAADEAAKTYRKTLFGNGYHMELPWPGAPPRTDQVQVHIRLTLADGKQLLTESTVSVKPIDRQARRDGPAIPMATSTPPSTSGSGNRLVDRLSSGASRSGEAEAGAKRSGLRAARSRPEWSPYR